MPTDKTAGSGLWAKSVDDLLSGGLGGYNPNHIIYVDTVHSPIADLTFATIQLALDYIDAEVTGGDTNLWLIKLLNNQIYYATPLDFHNRGGMIMIEGVTADDKIRTGTDPLI
jgi:hypothetical protein